MQFARMICIKLNMFIIKNYRVIEKRFASTCKECNVCFKMTPLVFIINAIFLFLILE